jgi:hypothetical protein
MALFPAFVVQRLGFCGLSGKSALSDGFARRNARFGRHKILKSRLTALPKAALRWYIPPAPKGVARVAFSGSLRTGTSLTGAGPFRFGDF